MPQVIAVALIGGLVWYAWRAFKREMGRVGEELQKQEAKSATSRDITQLEPGPDGVFRPRERD